MPTDTQERIDAVEQAEQAVLGSILVDSSFHVDRQMLTEVAKILRPADFRWPQHQRIYAAMLSCRESPNQIIVAEELNTQGKLETGDCAYLSHCIVVTPTSLDCLDYAEVVRRYALERRGGKPRQRGLEV